MKQQATLSLITKGIGLKKLFLITLLCVVCNHASSQEHTDQLVTTLTERLQAPIQDSTQLYKELHSAVILSKNKEANDALATSYKNLATWHMGNPTIDSTLHYLNKAAQVYKTIQQPIKRAEVYLLLENTYKLNTKYDKATQYAFKALDLYEARNNNSGIAEVFLRLSDLFSYKNDYQKGIEYAQKAIELLLETNEYEQLAKSYQYLAVNELFDYKTEIALEHINKAIALLEENNISTIRLLSCRNTRGNIYKYLERYDDAVADYRNNLTAATQLGDLHLQIASNGNLGHVHVIQKQYAKALPYLLQAIELIKKSGNTVNLWENYMHAAEAYENLGDFKNALTYERLLAEENKQYYNTIIARQEGELEIKYETAKKAETISMQENTIDRQRKNQLLYIGLTVVFAALLLVAFLSLRNIRKKRKELSLLNEKLNEKGENLKDSNTKLNKTIVHLKATQEQLIQSEKMASLGELTAGIAHEIQNPLNFVNNFSEVSNELMDEMDEEIEKGDLLEAKNIAVAIKQNLEKINHHGKRADAIVKGMLQHSRKSNAEKEPTDVNKLADEYLRLSYHGLRAKDKSFNATLETNFDARIGLVNIIPQDMGRVILNLITNAFYATNEKKQLNPEANYTPKVSVTTKLMNTPSEGKDTGKRIEISIKDNGNGIPDHVIDKIFQPFFTTKPTGEGTGLGLSMSYDIVTKGHGGELLVVSEEGTFTEFNIIIPTL